MMLGAVETRTPPSEKLIQVGLVDCDVHLAPRSPDELLEYLDEPWRSRITPRVITGKPTYTPFGDAMRGDSHSPVGVPGSDPDLVCRQLFVETQTDYALVLPIMAGLGLDPDQNAAVARAVNRWLAETWLTVHNAESRFFGAINVPVDNPAAAAREIEQWAGHPGFRQVLIAHYGGRPFGHPQYEPIWEAAARHGLPVAMHFMRVRSEPIGLSPTGPFEHFVDFHSLAYPIGYAAHLVSWICSGVFDRHPELRFVLVEGGFLWYRPIIARLERHWRRTAADLPAAGRSPLEYVRDHVGWTTQPVEEADRPGDVARALELAEAGRVLMFSSDYPHYDYDLPSRALPAQLDQAIRRRIMSGNALELYGLPSVRARDRFDRAADSM